MTARSVVASLVAVIVGTPPSAVGPREHTYVSFDVSADGRSVVFAPADGINGLYLLDLRARTVRELTSVRGIATSPAFSPDGKEIAFAAAADPDQPFHLFVYSFATQKVSQITDESFSDRGPSYSSNGSTIVFARAHRQRPYSTGGLTWDDWDVITIGRDGSSIRRRTNVKYYRLASPRFAANDSLVLYSAMDRGTNVRPTLFRLSLQPLQSPSSISPSITKSACGSRGSDPQLSRDERKLAFIADGQECYSYDIYVADPTGSDAKALGVTAVSTYNQQPVFLPGTDQVMYLAGTQEAGGGRSRYSLYTVGLDGSEPHAIAGPNLFDDPLHWRGK